MSMTVGNLKRVLEHFDDDLEVFFKIRPPYTGNIAEFWYVGKSEYGFFGKSVPCVLLDSESESEQTALAATDAASGEAQ